MRFYPARKHKERGTMAKVFIGYSRKRLTNPTYRPEPRHGTLSPVFEINGGRRWAGTLPSGADSGVITYWPAATAA